jgi:PucR family transcriptional regulator, purine catabolism regulatory protein
MVSIANDQAWQVEELPATSVYGLPVRALLSVPSLAGTLVLGGRAGLDRLVRRLNVMEVPDILPWVKPNEFLLTTGFPLSHTGGEPSDASTSVAAFVQLIEDLNSRDLAAMGIKLGRYLDSVPAEVVRRADELNFPLLRLPDDVAFDEVLSEVFTELIDRQAREISRTDEVHRALAAIVLEGGDLPQIADEVARVLDAAVLISTPDGRVQARGGDPAWFEQIAALDLVDHSGRFRVERIEAFDVAAPGPWAMVSIVAGGVDHGRIAAYRPYRPLPSLVLQALERAATVAALAITKQLAVAAVESKFRGDYLRDVLTGSAGDIDDVIAHTTSLGWDVRRPLVVVVAELDPVQGPPSPPSATGLRSPYDRFTGAWQQVLRSRDKAAPVVGFRNEVVALVPIEPGSGDPLASAAIAKAVDEIVTAVAGDRGGGRRSFCAGVSRLVVDPSGIAAAYVQARKAVAVGRRVRGPGSVSHFDSLGVHRLLSLVTDGAELRAFAVEVLGELAEETDDAADLRRTLQSLLDTNLNVAETARALHFHYNTLRYRIGKLERIIGPFSTDPHLRLDVALALQIVQMRGI